MEAKIKDRTSTEGDDKHDESTTKTKHIIRT